MDKVKFKKQVVPGDQLIMTAKFVKRRGTIAVVEAKAEVEGKLAASGTLTLLLENNTLRKSNSAVVDLI